MSCELSLGIRIRSFTRRARQSRGWTVEEFVDKVNRAGYETKVANWHTRNHRNSPVTIEEAVAFAAALRLSGVDELIKASESPCERCNGTPPEGFICTLCEAGREAS